MGHTQTKADKSQLAYVGRKPGGRDSNSWFTPPAYVELVRQVLGDIELDPFSSAEANEVVGAARYFSVDRSAFEHEWLASTVFMNPPYSSGLSGRASARFLDQWSRYGFTAIVLTNNSTETRWFQALLCATDAICFVNHKISFWNSDGKAISGNTRGQVFFYFGPDAGQFKAVFESIGRVIAL
jgi:hypothetical protein